MILSSMSYDRLSTNDPDKDYKTIINNTMAFLCERQMTLEKRDIDVKLFFCGRMLIFFVIAFFLTAMGLIQWPFRGV